MEPEGVGLDGPQVDWGYLPPTALHVIGTVLPSSSLLKARIVNHHWACCLAGVVDTLYVVPEYFQNSRTTSQLPEAFPKATTVNLDLQDTFISVTQEVKDSLSQYEISRGFRAGAGGNEGADAGPSAPGGASTATGAASSSNVDSAASEQAGDRHMQPAEAESAPQPAGLAGGLAAGSQPAAPIPVPAPAQQPQQPHAQQAQQAQQQIAALAAAFAAGLLNGNPGAAIAAAANAANMAGQPQAEPVPPPPPKFVHSAIPAEPLEGVVPPNASHLRVRLPDNNDVATHSADVATSWSYVASLLETVGPKLSGLSLSAAPGAAHISMLAPLTQLTSLTMDEASHSTWSTEHIPIVGGLTNLRNLAIKIPPFRTTRTEPVPGSPAAAAAALHPGVLSTWTALKKLTKLHVSALRYSYHSSLVAILPSLTQLEYLALRAPQTRLPWPGTDKPLFANIGLLTGLTQLSLALGDHNMVPQNWQSLTTLSRLSSIELSVSEGSDGLNVPTGLDFPALRSLKLRYPNSQDLVRMAGWSGLQKLDIKFPEHEREWHQEDAVLELVEFASKLPPTAGAAVIASVLDNSPAAIAAGGGSSIAAAASPAAVAAAAAAEGRPPGTAAAPQAPAGAGGAVGLTSWWSPLLPLLALPNMTDFRCSAKEGLASHDPILFDEILTGLCAAWPGITRLCFKGCINVATQGAGWDSLRALTRLQQLELRHHPPLEGEPANAHGDAANRQAARARFLRVEPIKLPATSLPDALQTLLLENVELRRKETDCLRNLTSLERRTTCRHFPEFEGMPLQRLVVSNCCVKAKGITSIATECAGLTHLVFAVYKVQEMADMLELQDALRKMVSSLKQLQVLKVRVLAGCITQDLVEDMVAHLPHLQRLKLTSSDGWEDTALFLPLTRMSGLRKCSLAYFKNAEAARLLRAEFRAMLPFCKIKAKHEA